MICGLLDCAVFGYMVGKGQWEHKPRGGWDNTSKSWIGKPSEACRAMDIKLVDHIIIGDNKFFSFAESGVL